MARLRADFEQSAPLGAYTALRVGEKGEPGEPQWGFYRLTSRALAAMETPIDYAALTAMSVLDAIATTEALCVAAGDPPFQSAPSPAPGAALYAGAGPYAGTAHYVVEVAGELRASGGGQAGETNPPVEAQALAEAVQAAADGVSPAKKNKSS